jgi:hypothetical protein
MGNPPVKFTPLGIHPLTPSFTTQSWVILVHRAGDIVVRDAVNLHIRRTLTSDPSTGLVHTDTHEKVTHTILSFSVFFPTWLCLVCVITGTSQTRCPSFSPQIFRPCPSRIPEPPSLPPFLHCISGRLTGRWYSSKPLS